MHKIILGSVASLALLLQSTFSNATVTNTTLVNCNLSFPVVEGAQPLPPELLGVLGSFNITQAGRTKSFHYKIEASGQVQEDQGKVLVSRTIPASQVLADRQVREVAEMLKINMNDVGYIDSYLLKKSGEYASSFMQFKDQNNIAISGWLSLAGGAYQLVCQPPVDHVLR